MNLSGFCCADPSACPSCGAGVPPQFVGPPVPPSAPTSAQEEAAALASYYGQKIAAAIYRVAAVAGCKVICPNMGFLVDSAIELLGVADVITLNLPGAAIDISLIAFRRLITNALVAQFCAGCK